MYFPLELPLGKHVPLYGSIPGRSFRLRRHPETTSQSEHGFRDVLSAWAAIGKARPALRCRSVCLTLTPCTEFDSPRYGASVNGLEPVPDARSASHLYRVEALRGESAYLLRKSAPASAGCRRPRPRAKNAFAFSLRPRPAQSSILRGLGGSVGAGHDRLKPHRHRIYIGLRLCAENPRICFANPHRLRPPAGVLARSLQTLTRFLYARALHRVRFSAVSIRNKKAGRRVYLPACNYWWRRGESNSGPRKPPDWHLQAQSLV